MAKLDKKTLIKRGLGSSPTSSPTRPLTVAEHNRISEKAGYHFATSDGKAPNGNNPHPYKPTSQTKPPPSNQHQPPARLRTQTEKHLPDSQTRPQQMLYAGQTKGAPSRIITKEQGGGVKPVTRTQRTMNKITGGLKKIGNALGGGGGKKH